MLELDVIQSKISIIKNCLRSIKKSTDLDPSRLEEQVVQDAFVLNLQRAAQAAIDIANTVIAQEGFKLPASYREAFQVLAKEKVIAKGTADKMGKMAGFRNIAIHNYQKLNLEVLQAICRDHLGDFEEFYSQVFRHGKKGRT